MQTQDIEQFHIICRDIYKQIERDVIGQKEIVENTLIAMISGGNVLLEGVPGVGKTRLVRSLGRVFDMSYSRIQFTPALMPADITGTNIIVKDEAGNSKFQFQQGPVFNHIVLADEINRATPKTQSALLEAMQEHTVTVMGVSHRLVEPFFVLATQNPIEQDGTYPLPEAQMDRFMFKLLVKNPSMEELKQIVNITQVTMEETAEPVCSGPQLLEMRNTAKEIPVADEVLDYALYLTMSTLPDTKYATKSAKQYIRYGASPRAAQTLISAAKVRALMNGRYNVSYGDLNALALPALRHRIKLNFEAITDKKTTDDVIQMIIKEIAGGREFSQKNVFASSSREPRQEEAKQEPEAEKDTAPETKAEEIVSTAAGAEQAKGKLFKSKAKRKK